GSFVYESLGADLSPAGSTSLKPTAPHDDRVPLVADRSGSTFMAWPPGYPTATSLIVVPFRSGQPGGDGVTFPGRFTGGDPHAALAVDGQDRLWAVWTVGGGVPSALRPRLLRAAGVRAAVAARVARAGADHAAAAAGALDRVLERVEQRGLAGWRRVDRRGLGGAVLERVVRLREPRPHLGREDPDLLLLVGCEELLAHPAEDVVDDRLRDADIRVVRLPARLEPHVRELRHVHLERHAVLEAERDRDHEGVHEAGERRAFLGDVDKDVAGRPVLVEADVDVALVVADAELAADLLAVVRQPLPLAQRHRRR